MKNIFYQKNKRVNKAIFFVVPFLLSFGSYSSLFAQAEIIDTTKMEFVSDEVIIFYSDPVKVSGNNKPIHKARYIDFDTSNVMQFMDSVTLQTGFRYTNWDSYGQTVAAGNYYGDNKEEIKYAYVSAQGQYRICDQSVAIPGDSFDTGGSCDTFAATVRNQQMTAVAANITGDSYDEFVLGYSTWSNDFIVTSGTATYTESGTGSGKLCKADFNSDGIDEIVFLGLEGNKPYIRVLSNNLSTASARLYLDTLNYSLRLSVKCGDVTGDGKPDIVFAFVSETPTANTNDTWAEVVEVGTNLTSFIYDQNDNLDEKRSGSSSSNPIALALDLADLNFDGVDEVILGAGEGNYSKIGVYQLNASDKLTLAGNEVNFYMSEPVESTNWLVGGDFNPQNNDLSIMVCESYDNYQASSGYTHSFEYKVYDVNPGTFNLTLNNAVTKTFQSDYSTRYYDLVKLDADNDKIKLGAGTHYFVSEYGQPVAVLNVPPIHFDVIGGDTVDLNDCHNNASCGSVVNYATTSTSSTVFTTELTGSYGFSNSITNSATIGALEVEAKVEKSGGTSLTNLKGSGQSLTTTTSIDLTREGDHVYMAQSDYHIWEYPVYIDGEKKGTFVTVEPVTSSFMIYAEAKTINDYHFDHDPSNILSYRDYNNPVSENPQLADSFYSASPITINDGSSITYSWEFGNELNSAVTKEKEKSLDISGSVGVGEEFDFYGVSVGLGMSTEISNSYSEAKMSTVESTLSNSFSVSVNPGGIAQSLVSTSSYKVQPYLYYDSAGVLYVDYATTFHPESQTGTTTSSWFYDKYGSTANPKQDPAFIMPFKLNDEKGYGPIHEIEKDRTSSIQMWPRNPSVGDTVLIGAIVHNFSLGPNPSDSVEISFYAESRQAGHCKTKIVGVDNGQAIFNIGKIDPRKSATVHFKWVYPGGLGPTPRIYGVIDPNNKIANEIHERNNKAFFCAGAQLALSAAQKDTNVNFSGTVYVDATVSGGNNDGSSWADAYQDLSKVLNEFNESFPDSVKVAQGTYLPDAGELCEPRFESFYVTDSIVVLGGYPSGGGTRNWQNNPTILSGAIGTASDSDNSYTVVYMPNANGSQLDGFIIENGNANLDYQTSSIDWWDKEGAGSAVYVDGEGVGNTSSPQISNCIIRNNKGARGGGFFVNGRDTGIANPIIESCIFYDNETTNDGGAMMTTAQYAGQSNPTVQQCLFYDNISATHGGALFTYARYSGESEPNIIQCTFVNNDRTNNTLYQRYSGSVPHIYNSIVWGDIVDNNSSTFTDATSILKSNNDAYPVFVDSANNNFRLSACSPAIGAGSNVFVPISITTDLDNTTRIQGDSVDMGVYEGGNLPKQILSTMNTSDTANVEFTDASGWTNYCNCDSANANNNRWMISLKKNGNNIGKVSDAGFQLTTTITSNYGSNTATDLSNATYVTADTFYAFNRYWQVTPTTQPTTAVEVRFPYSTTDFNDLKSSQPNLTNHTEMAFFKIDGGLNPHSLSVPSSAYHNYTNGINADTVTWKYTDYTTEIPNIHIAEYAVNSFSGGGGGFGNGTNNGPLPVTYLNFSVVKQANVDLIKWTTKTEINNSHFNVQRSANGKYFETLGRVNSKKENNSTIKQINYSYTDETPLIGHNYYRLEQVDIDGKKNYSKVINIIWTAQGAFAFYPNPTKEKLNIDFSQDEENLIEVKLFDMSGRVVKSILLESIEGQNHIEFSTSELSSGIYNIQLLENGAVIYKGKIQKN